MEWSNIAVKRRRESLDVLHEAFENIAFAYVGGPRFRLTVPENVRAHAPEQEPHRDIG